MMRLAAIAVFFVACLSCFATDACAADRSDPFVLDGKQNILAEEHFGILNGRLTVGIAYRDAFAVQGLWAPPYVSSDFQLNLTLFDRPVETKHYEWHPYGVRRSGEIEGVAVDAVAKLVYGARAGLVKITLRNTTDKPLDVPVAIQVQGTLDRSLWWEFAAPKSQTATTPKMVDRTMLLQQGDMAVAVRAGEPLHWEDSQPCAKGSLSLPSRGKTEHYVVFAIGPVDEAEKACKNIADDPEKAMAEARAAYADQVQNLFQKLPTLKSNSPALDKLYNRSLVHLLLNRWDVSEFVLRPYYSTGSVRGGCVCNYLWNFGELWEILPLLDPAAAKTHIKKFLEVDMTQHFAFEPTTGKAFGPWYMVNQEKIVGLIYFYVKNTGDTAFLSEKVDGKSVLEHAILNALHGDDPSKPVALIDYGESNSHLELRRGLPYNHVMPDLNGRRYNNYLFAAELAELAGKPEPMLRRRAEELKTVLKNRLWNKETRWFDFEDAQGKKDTRWTVQMFKLLGSGVLDEETTSGLLEHLLSEKEFLSEHGLHSLAKNDLAYDPADVDNGGPGACTCFPPQIIERLYKSGNPDAAENILKRILWWGERMPYWGDSIVAERIDYRRDTPLQCTIDGATVAQSIVFGLFGVRADFNGDIRVDPRPPAFATKIELENLCIRGQELDIAVDGKNVQVRHNGRILRSTVGRPIVVSSR